MTQRLFDLVKERYDTAPSATLLAAKENGRWREYPVSEVWETACAMANGLLELGVATVDLSPEGQEKIAIISPNRPEWIITDLAVQLSGAVLTPIYPTIAPHELVFVLKDAGVKKLLIADHKLYDNFKEAIKNVPELVDIFSFDAIPGVRSWRSLHSDNKNVNQSVVAQITTDTLATIIYTSGTTGNPKGVMLSHSNIACNVRDSMPAFTFAKVGERTLSFLPLNHIFERMITYIYVKAGLSIWYAESMETIGDNLKEVQPMVFCTVPRLLEKVYEKIMAKGLELKGIKRALFFWAVKLGKKYDNVQQGSAWYRLQLKLANRLIFAKWREALGGKVKAIVTGSAACQERLIRIFSSANIVIMEGYGLTETSPVISVNRFESEGRRIGTIGLLIDNVAVKIADDGEILCKGPNVMIGYYKQPELTATVMQDGWFHTGDIGTWVEDRFLKITDRKKEIFKTSGGKYVAPQPIENKMRESIFIEQIMVLGAGRKFVSALIVPSMMQLRKALQDAGNSAPDDNAQLIALPAVQQIIRGQLDKYNVQFGHVEQVKKFKLLPHEWTIDSGELTPSLKVKRKVLEAKFEKEIEDLYD